MTKRRMFRVVIVVALAVFVAGFGIVSPASAADVSPTNVDDGSAGSLRGILENLPDSTTTVVLPAGSGPYDLGCPEGADVLINDVVDTIVGNGNTINGSCESAGVHHRLRSHARLRRDHRRHLGR